jgi:hypothetical protein
MGANPASQESVMTKKIGNKHIAQHRGKKERAEIHKSNVAREAVKQAIARAKYRNLQKGQPNMVLAQPAA